MNEDDARTQKPVSGFTRVDDVLSSFMQQGMATLPDAATVEKAPAATIGKAAKKTRQPSAKLAKAAAEIAARPDDPEFALTVRELVQCTLPHRDPGNVPLWTRKNGDLTLVLQPGVDETGTNVMGFPSGSIPRLLMFWLVGEANKNILNIPDLDVITRAEFDQARRVELGQSLSGFLRAMGLDPNTGRGKRGDATRLKEQMQRLFHCKISFRYNPASGKNSWLDMQVAPKGEVWWDYHNPDQSGLCDSYIILGEDFFKAITAAPVPVDFRALKALKQSPFALDLYAWVTYRIHTLQDSGRREVTIPLASLKQQFGAEYNRLDNFKAALVDALAKVQEVYPALDYTLEKSALVLRAGRRAVQPRSSEKRKVLAQHQAKQMADEMSQRVSETMCAKFSQTYPLHSVGDVLEAFYTWRDGKQIKSVNADAHFWDFVTNHYFKR